MGHDADDGVLIAFYLEVKTPAPVQASLPDIVRSVQLFAQWKAPRSLCPL